MVIFIHTEFVKMVKFTYIPSFIVMEYRLWDGEVKGRRLKIEEGYILKMRIVLIATLVGALVLPNVMQAKSTFSDISEDHWAASAISWGVKEL